jgi:hypothetical protein
MKSLSIVIYSFFASMMFITTACSNKEMPPRIIIQPPPPPPSPSNQLIWVDANMNITIELPMNFAMLNGIVTGPGRNGVTYNWQKVSGPSSCTIENPDSLVTKVSNLELGVYQFKFTATNISGQARTDSMTLIVQDPTSSNKQLVFWNVNWECSLECSIYLGNVSQYLPANGAISVYIRREGQQNWDLVVPESNFTTERYFYVSSSGQLSVVENSILDATDHPEIKIVY